MNYKSCFETPPTQWWIGTIVLCVATLTTGMLAVRAAADGTAYGGLLWTLATVLFLTTVVAAATPRNIIYDDIREMIDYSRHALSEIKTRISPHGSLAR